MEKTDKQYADEFFAISQHMHTTIKRLLEAGNYPLAMKLLEQCQSYAIHLGQRIELTEGESSLTVNDLEDYCELVYQIYEKLRCFSSVDANDVHNRLATQLIRVRSRIRDTDDRK